LADGGLRYREHFAGSGGSASWRSPAGCRSRSGATSRPASCLRAPCASLTPHSVLDPQRSLGRRIRGAIISRWHRRRCVREVEWQWLPRDCASFARTRRQLD